MNTNLTQNDDSIEFQKTVISPYKCPQHLILSNDSLFLSSLRDSDESEESFFVVSEIAENTQIVISSNFVKKIRYIVTNPYDLEQVKSSLLQAQKFNDDNLQQVHQYVIENGSLLIYSSFSNQCNYLQERIQLESRNLSNEIKLRSYLYNIMEGLKYLHDNNYVHMCLTLQNIECHKDEYRQFKISRFETLSQINSQMSQSLRQYLKKMLPVPPPELDQVVYQIDSSFDIYCFGVVIFQICTCSLPDENQRTNRLILRKFVSKELTNMILLMLEAVQYKRPTAAELIDNQWFNI